MEQVSEQKYNGLSANVLKIIAVVTMFTDHFTVVFLTKFVQNVNWGSLSSDSLFGLQKYYILGRGIGRLAFPLFAFFVAEGMFYTRDRRKYLERLFLFALISEIPFDFGIFGNWFDSDASNVIFTLFLGGVAIYLSDIALGKKVIQEENGAKKLAADSDSNAKNMPVPLRIVIAILICLGVIYLGNYFHTDYSAAGVSIVIIDYLFMYEFRSVSGYSERAGRLMGFALSIAVLTVFSSSFEIVAAIDLIFIFLYNGKRGAQHKYFFYIFYPAHLMLLRIIYYFVFLY